MHCLLLITLENGTTWSFKGSSLDNNFYRPIEELRLRSACSPMFKYPEPICKSYYRSADQFTFLIAPGMYKFITGTTTDYYDETRPVVTFADVFDSISLGRINHSASCTWCRRLWSTLQFRHPLAEDQVWAGLVSEFLKLLASTSVQSGYLRVLLIYDLKLQYLCFFILFDCSQFLILPIFSSLDWFQRRTPLV